MSTLRIDVATFFNFNNNEDCKKGCKIYLEHKYLIFNQNPLNAHNILLILGLFWHLLSILT